MLILSPVKTVCRNWLPDLRILAVLVCAVVGAAADEYAEDNDWSRTDNPWLYHQCVMYIKKYDKKSVIAASIASVETAPPAPIAFAAKLDNKTVVEKSTSDKGSKESSLSQTKVGSEPSSAGKQFDIATL